VLPSFQIFWHEVVALGCIFEKIILVWAQIGQPT